MAQCFGCSSSVLGPSRYADAVFTKVVPVFITYMQPVHRTVSLDYGIVAKGSIVLELDDGERITLNEGDTIVQRGTMHAWRNESTEWARIYFVVLGASSIPCREKDNLNMNNRSQTHRN